MSTLAKLTLFLPLIGFLIAGIISRINPRDHNKKNQNFSDKFAQYFTTILMVISALCAIAIFLQFKQTRYIYSEVIFNFIKSQNFIANWSIHIDALSAVMIVVVTLVSSLVHLYSIGYMHEDKSIARFMSYLSLFTFFMLALVLSDNFIQLFFGWEGVGVASYLLIGFWFKKDSANRAAMKAFIANRVGDLGLILAIALIYVTFGSVEYNKVFYQICAHSGDRFFINTTQFLTVDTICILLFIGAMGKSAQIFLHVWLADAMEGPTPVSALIHAATMVTAGVFLVARCSPMFELSPIALDFVCIVGAITAIFSATIALTQNDIKKIIAYSTCSQLGYMFFACGVSAYSGAIFHLATHAFFKALLFLGAGSVIHALHHQQDITKMGGLYKKIPFTYAMMWIGSLALAGFPPFAGHYSKDVILESAYMAHTPVGTLAFYLGLTTAFLTAFYSWRLLFLTFHGKTRADHHHFDHAHESPLTMLIPLAILAIGSIGAGYYGSHYLKMVATNGFFDSAIVVALDKFFLYDHIHHAPNWVKLSPLIAGVLGILLAFYFYISNPKIPAKLAHQFKTLYNISYNKWYFDELYQKILINPILKLSNFSWKFIDQRIIDGIPNGAAAVSRNLALAISKIQSGIIYHYATWIVIGLVVFGLIFLDYAIPIISKGDTFYSIFRDSIANLFYQK